MKIMKKSLVILATVLVLSLACLLSSCGSLLEKALGENSEGDFYNKVLETKDMMDIVADDIYQNWYDSIYNDKFNSDIDKAIDAAFEGNDDLVTKILENTTTIEALYKKVKDGRLSKEAKEVMQAYNRYYSVVLEVSGSFNDFSDTKEPAKKELAQALKNYYTEY